MEIVRRFDNRQIQYRLLKGAAFARWLYDDPSSRTYGDIDLLVAPGDFAAAGGVLRDLGFRPELPGLREVERLQHHYIHHHDCWARGGGLPARVELHRTLNLLTSPPPLVWELFSEDARAIEIAGTKVAVPSEAASALIAALHAFQHATAARPAEDLRRVLAAVDSQTWRAAGALASKLSCEGALAAGLCLLPGGQELAARLDLHGEPPTVPDPMPPPTVAGIERFVKTKGVAAKLRLLTGDLVPSPEFMRYWQPIARRGRWGLALAYLWRPFWLLAKLPQGLRAWRAAEARGRDRRQGP